MQSQYGDDRDDGAELLKVLRQGRAVQTDIRAALAG
jgi:hypothetical protein